MQWSSEPSRRASTVTLGVEILLLAEAGIRWIGPTSVADAWLIGAIWLGMTLAFKILAGHYVFGNSWEAIWSDYDVLAGRIWVGVPIVTWVAPAMAYAGFHTTFATPYARSNAEALVVLFLVFRTPKLARMVIGAVFGYAATFNAIGGLYRPEEYQGFADRTSLPLTATS